MDFTPWERRRLVCSRGRARIESAPRPLSGRVLSARTATASPQTGQATGRTTAPQDDDVQPAQQEDAPGTTTPNALASAEATRPGWSAELLCSTTATLSIFMVDQPSFPVCRNCEIDRVQERISGCGLEFF
ncbi:hypothetical protein H4696_000248 [Amycolatopsis lexingtonensis]|uniref:Uncharacterized protein n=1 Tax=Amycolatopsis lexingtonensis TaxID=218822 RepID=A0ABR9HQD6_9PSEU|nr:hypothetical protein [Amycolatopsis lexingtonensis]MBE1493148.1 hypothetical protein [Amycolatopsis lexingtonensis]